MPFAVEFRDCFLLVALLIGTFALSQLILLGQLLEKEVVFDSEFVGGTGDQLLLEMKIAEL